jgi:hypothetical protein
MLGMGRQAVSFLVNLNSALANCDIIVPTVDELLGCTTAQEVEDIQIPTKGKPGFKGSSIYIPDPIFQNAIILLGSTNPFKLIPLMNTTARAFEAKARNGPSALNGNPINHADNINAWLYGVRQGTIPKTRYLVLPDDVKITNFNTQCHLACISQGGFQGGAAHGVALANNDAFHSLVWQLTYGVAAQTKVLAESNNIQERFIQRQDSREEAKQDRTKKIHPSIINMIGRAAAPRGDNTKVLPKTCLQFFNQESMGMAQYDLVHQFKDLKAPDVIFASGTTNTLYIGQFLWADSSTPSNFTIFAFCKQEPNTDNHQEDYLVCHLI